ncbi:DEAD/DEAH box helicase [Amycolatopsis sp. CA-230715]|uniref:DEAD/DEAH box helicase n=1 Tax=Amycolatopsis sp. CA-230715 TaxID=2745196 RepID=UPI001C01C4D6|nr:DEAD/DEAH box helicase [Amycolatopsis sp. CA-230715]QWF83053.1 ATP-dependent RNA helicase DeaD [Amycolatopsis sp. CA-230715]
MTIAFDSGNSTRQARKPRQRPAQESAKTPSLGTGPTKSFADLNLPEPLLRALREAGIDKPFPIQSATLPDALAGRDVLGRAQTGSGKTLAFGLALLTRLDGGKARAKRPRALVLVPTRELAMQVADSLTPLAKALGLWCRTAVGGMAFGRQADALNRGVDLLIATPGRLSDHVRQGTAVLSDINFVALDEADQMADMGFLPQVREILDLTPARGQRLLFSATLDGDVKKLVDSYLTDPVEHSVAPVTASVTTMDHHVLQVQRQDKQQIITEIGARDGRTIMFVRTKHHVDRLTERLREQGVHAAALHGGKTQGQRNRVLADFKDGHTPVLVATDVAARGIHVDDISLVLHVDPAADHKDYLHRSGRTARAGASGAVVTLITNDQRRMVRRMTDRAGVRAESTMVRPGDAELRRITGAREPSGEPVIERRREPSPRRGGGPRGRSGGFGSGGHGGGGYGGGRGRQGGGFNRGGGRPQQRSNRGPARRGHAHD